MFQDFNAGVIQAAQGTYDLAVNSLQTGTGRAIARWPRRCSKLPDVPTFLEQGVNSRMFGLRGYICLAGPSAMPQEIVERLSALMVEAGRSERVQRLLDTLGIDEAAVGYVEARAAARGGKAGLDRASSAASGLRLNSRCWTGWTLPGQVRKKMGGKRWTFISGAPRIFGPAAPSWRSGPARWYWRRIYPLGSAARMGPAYFPTVLGLVLVVIGVLVLLKSLASADGGNVGRIDLWLLLRVLLPVAAFAVLLNPLGLVATAVVVVMLAAWAGHEFRLGEALASAAVLALGSYLLFVKALGQTMPVWPWFLAG